MATTNALIRRIQTVRSAGESYWNSTKLKTRKDEIERNFMPSYTSMSSKFKNMLISYMALSKILQLNEDFGDVIQYLIEINTKTQRDEFDKQLVYALQKELDRILANLSVMWGNYVSERTTDIKSILKSLDKLILDMPEKRILDEKSSKFANSAIGDPAAIKAIDEYIETYNVLMGKLHLKQGVLNFLRLFALGKTVTLGDMDEEVYDWFRGSDFSRKIMINMRQ